MLDLIPPFLLKEIIDVLLPCMTDGERFITRRMTASHSKMHHHHSTAEKPSLEVGALKNYSLVPNVTFMSKVIKRITAQ